MSSAGWYVSKDGFRIPKSDNALRAKWDADYLQRVKDYFGTPGREFVPTEIPVDKVAGGHNVMPGHPRTNFYARLYKLGEPVPPIVVSEVGTGFYNVLDGNRRIASAKMANKSHVPALLIRDTKKTSTTKAPHVYTPTKVKKLGKSEPLMAGAAFRHLPTGKIFNVGPWHDTTRLPGGLNPEPGQEEFMPREDASGNLTNYEAGFVDRKGKFYNRQEAAKAVGAQSKSTPQYARLTGLESRIYALGHDEGIYKKEQNLYCDIDLSKNERDVPEQLPPRIARALWAIRQPGVLTDELRKPEYRSNPNPFAGHCFVASDALMHLIDGHRTGWQLKCIHKEHLKDEDTHWFLQHRKTGHIIDPTADQFEGDVPYEKGVAKGTSQTGSNVGHPTKRAQVVIDRVKGLLNDQPYEYLGTLQHDGSEFYIQAPDEELEKAENGRRIPLDEIHKKYNFFHISSERLHPKGSKFWFAKPRVPESVMEGEDMETPRTCVGPTIHHCAAGVEGVHVAHVKDPQGYDIRGFVGYHVYGIRNPVNIVRPTKQQVPDAPYTGERWLTKPAKLEYLGELERDPNLDDFFVKKSEKPFAKRDLDPSLGYKISSQPHPSGLDVMAHDKMGQQVGRAIIGPDARGLNIAHTVYVDEAHQRRGIASAMYQHAEKVTGQRLHPSPLQTEDAEALWVAPRKFGKAESKLSPGGLRYRSDDGNTEEWDYSHLLPEKARGEGYRVRVRTFRQGPNGSILRSRIQVFTTKSQAGKSRPAGQLVGSWQANTLSPWESRVEEQDRRKHLGQAMYEAMYAHGRAHLGLTEVAGDYHSTSAHLVHKKLARKHGLNYEANPNVGRGRPYSDMEDWRETPPHDSDARYSEYKYKLPDVTQPKQVNMFAEHRLPGSLDAEGYKLNVAHTPEGAIGTIHRNGQVLGHIELNKDGRPFEEWTGNGRREGLRDAVLMILRGHQEGQAYQDGWNQPVKGSAPLTKAELSTPLTSSGNLSQYENMHKMQGNEGKHGIWNSLSEGQVISETTMQGLCKSENLLEVQCREGGLGIRNTTSERENLSKVSMQGLSGQSPSRANSSESREGRSSSLSQQPRIAGGGQEVSKGESRQHQGLAGRTEEYVKVSDGPTEGCSVHGLPSNVSSVCNGLGPSRPLNKVGERSLNARPLGEMGYSSGGSSEVRPGVFELSQNSNFHPSPQGSDVTIPHRTYTEASRVKPKGQKYSGGNNLWARNHSSESNADRTLAVQFSSDLLQGGRLRDASDDYYDKLYVSREGYKRPADFWEIPAWTSHLAYSLPDMDHYTVRDPEEAIRFLNSAGYKHVAFSALDVNKDFVKRLAQGAPNQHVVVGGYTDMSHFNGLPNVSVHPTIESFVKSEGREYQPGYDYRHFSGTPVIPRLTLSDGCRHNCTFCCVPKQIDEKGREEILQQADAFAEHIPSDLIYINDKTYGQAKNHSMLPELYQHIKAKNPNFKGFIVQTTAAQMKRFTPEFLRQAGIKHIELGVESVNDPILRAHKKPANEELIQEAADKIRTSGASLIPNIMVGLPGENRDTYARTLGWLEKNKDIISHVNAYNLALYDESELGKKLQAISAADRDENVQQKSWHTDPQVHKDFAEALWRFASGQLDQPIGHTQPIQKAERYAVKTPHAPPVDPENYQIYESPMGHHLLTPDNNEQWFSTPKKRDEYLEFHQSILGRPAGVTNLGFRKSELNKNEPVRSPYYQANEPGSYAVYQSPIGYHLVTARGNEQVFNSSGERDKYLAWHQSMGGKKPVKDLGFVQSEGALAKAEIDQNESIAVCIMVQDGFGRTLWGKRRKDGKFCMPGGHVEEGEAPAQAAVRELHEEVGLVPKTMWLLGSGNGIEGPVHVYHAICNGQATTANDPDREFSELVWEDCLRGPPPYITANLAHPRDIAYDLMGWRGPE